MVQRHPALEGLTLIPGSGGVYTDGWTLHDPQADHKASRTSQYTESTWPSSSPEPPPPTYVSCTNGHNEKSNTNIADNNNEITQSNDVERQQPQQQRMRMRMRKPFTSGHCLLKAVSLFIIVFMILFAVACLVAVYCNNKATAECQAASGRAEVVVIARVLGWGRVSCHKDGDGQ